MFLQVERREPRRRRRREGGNGMAGRRDYRRCRGASGVDGDLPAHVDNM